MTLGRNLAVILVATVVLSAVAATAPSPAQAGETGRIIAGAVIGGLIGAAIGDRDDRCGSGYGYGYGYRPPVGRPYNRYEPPHGYYQSPRRAYNEGYRDGWYDGRDYQQRQDYAYGPYGGGCDTGYGYGYGGGYGGGWGYSYGGGCR